MAIKIKKEIKEIPPTLPLPFNIFYFMSTEPQLVSYQTIVSMKRRDIEVYVELLSYNKCMKIQIDLFYYCIRLY